ncbi:MAG: sigma 54-interacting transcriptional regulator [Acidobacteriota bacterium]
MKPATILLLDLFPANGLSKAVREILETSLRLAVKIEQFVVITDAGTGPSDHFKMVSRLKPSILFLTLECTSLSETVSTLRSIRAESTDVPVIVVVDACEPHVMLELLREGASDFITCPFEAIDIVPRVLRLLEQSRQEASPVRALKERLGLRRLVGESPAFLSEVNKFPVLARSDASILILGETGTGKELCARAIHYLSPRASKPFVPVNCGAIPLDLVENELFGHEREAFTGAATSRLGLIHEAGGGTLFMDEIDCLPLLAQVKLLRFLQEKEYRPLGSMKMRQADVRVMAATNVDLEEAVRKGRLRQDLYYRLNVIPLVLPPLRERREDIPLLVRHFLAKYSEESDKQTADLSQDAMHMLLVYEWPGNVRELEHVIQRAVVMCEQGVIGTKDIYLPRAQTRAAAASFREMKAGMIEQFERTYINSLLRAHDGNITKAARAAQKDPRALRQLMHKHSIDGRSFRSGA